MTTPTSVVSRRPDILPFIVAAALALVVAFSAYVVVSGGNNSGAVLPVASPSSEPSPSRPPSGEPATTASPSPSVTPTATSTPAVTPTPTAKPSTPAATPTPKPAPTGTPIPRPSDTAADGIDFVDLTNASGARSTIIVWDETESLADARSGSPGDGASVPYDRAKVANIDADTLRVTWSDLPIESQARLSIRMTESGRFEMRLVRPRPQQSDSLATDRVLDLDFHVAVTANEVGMTLVDDLLPSTSMGFGRVELENTTGNESFAVVWDETDSLVGIESGSPGDGSSVHYDDVKVENVRENAVQLTWSEMPRDGQTRLSLRRAEDGTYRIGIVRTVAAERGDSMATDRVLELRFLVAVPAADVAVTLVDTLE